ncbi:MAG: hypothetical protein FJX76_01745 [Armatimonadetes bacterium]|nr:hypothetical protein [Armatimonadota bacterium]
MRNLIWIVPLLALVGGVSFGIIKLLESDTSTGYVPETQALVTQMRAVVETGKQQRDFARFQQQSGILMTDMNAFRERYENSAHTPLASFGGTLTAYKAVMDVRDAWQAVVSGAQSEFQGRERIKRALAQAESALDEAQSGLSRGN